MINDRLSCLINNIKDKIKSICAYMAVFGLISPYEFQFDFETGLRGRKQVRVKSA